MLAWHRYEILILTRPRVIWTVCARRTKKMYEQAKICPQDSAPRPALVWTASCMRIPQCGPARTLPAPVCSALYSLLHWPTGGPCDRLVNSFKRNQVLLRLAWTKLKKRPTISTNPKRFFTKRFKYPFGTQIYINWYTNDLRKMSTSEGNS